MASRSNLATSIGLETFASSRQARRITVHDARRTCATLLVDLDVHPGIAMAILQHADFSITMEIYSHASPKATRDALRRLGKSLLYFAAVQDRKRP
jgi:integrase